MRFTLNAEIEIERPVAEAFKFVATDHITNHGRWDPGVIRMIQLTEGPLALHSRFQMVRRVLGREQASTFEVIEWLEFSLMTIASLSKNFDLTLVSHFESLAGDRTNYVFTAYARISGPGALGAPMLRRILRSQLPKSLAKIKDLVEHDASGQSAPLA